MEENDKKQSAPEPIRVEDVPESMGLLQSLLWECLRFVLASHALGALRGEFKLGLVVPLDPIASSEANERKYLAVQTGDALWVLRALPAHPLFEWRNILGPRWNVDARSVPKNVYALNEESSAGFVAQTMTTIARDLASSTGFRTEAFGDPPTEEPIDGTQAILSAATFLACFVLGKRQRKAGQGSIWPEWSDTTPNATLRLVTVTGTGMQRTPHRLELRAIRRSWIWSWVESADVQPWRVHAVVLASSTERETLDEAMRDIAVLLWSVANETAQRALLQDPGFLKRLAEVQKRQAEAEAKAKVKS